MNDADLDEDEWWLYCLVLSGPNQKSKKGTIIRDFDVKLNPSPSHSYGQYHVTKAHPKIGPKKEALVYFPTFSHCPCRIETYSRAFYRLWSVFFFCFLILLLIKLKDANLLAQNLSQLDWVLYWFGGHEHMEDMWREFICCCHYAWIDFCFNINTNGPIFRWIHTWLTFDVLPLSRNVIF